MLIPLKYKKKLLRRLSNVNFNVTSIIIPEDMEKYTLKPL